MLLQNVEKEMTLNHARYLRFFRIRREKVSAKGPMHPVQMAADSLPTLHRETLEMAFYQSLAFLMNPQEDILANFICREELEEKFHQLDRAVDHDPGFRALGHMEREAARLNNMDFSAAALEGLGFGTVGIGSPETVILCALMLRTLYETGLVYGFNIDHPWEKDLADGITPEIDRERRMHTAAARMAGSMSLQKFVQGIPVIGAAGLFFNTAAMNRLQTLSRCVYKQRYLRMKERAYKAGHIS